MFGAPFQNEEYSHTFFAMVLVCDRVSYTRMLLFVGAFLERGIFTHLFDCSFVLDSSLACVVLYTCPIVVTALYRTRNIHTLHSPVYFCWRLGVSLCLGRLFWNEEYSHTFFACLFILDSSLACMVASRL